MSKTDEQLVIRESAEWLRYVFIAATIGLLLLFVTTWRAPNHDVGKLVGIVAGIVLCGFSALVYKSRAIVIDPTCREVRLVATGLRGAPSDSIAFAQIKNILIVTTSDRVEDSRGVEQTRARWTLAFTLDSRTAQVTTNLYVTKAGALRDAKRMQALLGVEIVDDVDAGVAHLAQSGQRVAAVMTAVREKGLDVADAKELADAAASASNRSRIDSQS